MTTNDYAFQVSLAILLALGFQYFIVGIFTLSTIDFSNFGFFNWLLQGVYLTFAISLSLKED